jgi:membrane-anchored protein YejM (alkaline phosphatase superfamily)
LGYQAGNYWLDTKHADSGPIVESYVNFDGSFRLVRSLLAPPKRRECDDFCEFLHQHANIRADAKLTAPETELAVGMPEVKDAPNIFVIVVDSLRPDYLSPYNSNVRFTPNIQAFAKQAAVLPNAFARYSGTALSEPSIWSGVAQPHQQFAQPFPAINSLEKLVDRVGYQKFVSVDTVLRNLLRRERNLTPLEWDDTNWSSLESCSVLPETKAKLARRARDGTPVFFYSQPIDVHQVVLSRKRVSGDPYPGFDASYATALQRLDRCFGEFINYLDHERLLANSIVVLTADHGDALGDRGRHGHSHGIFPEMLRIPLIIRLPETMRSKYVASNGQIAFASDIAPTLMYLLGQHSIKNDPMFGRPLLTLDLEEQRQYRRPSYLVSSDAAPVFGLLGGDAESLYIADAVSHREYWFDLKQDPSAANNLITPEISRVQREILRKEILNVARFYNYTPPNGGLEAWLNR